MKKITILIALLFIQIQAQQEQIYSIYSLNSSIKENIQTEEINIPLFQIEKPAKKNAGLAILYSLLLPGMGELYAGGYESGKYFTIAEAVLWGSYIGMDAYGTWQKNNYQSFASSYGSVVADSKDEDYYANIGVYLDINQYNRDKLLSRRFEELYDTETHFWKWENNEQRREYREMWVSSETAFNNLRFIAGTLILNRIISAINAVRVTAAHNKRIANETSWNIQFGLENNYAIPSGWKLQFVMGL